MTTGIAGRAEAARDYLLDAADRWEGDARREDERIGQACSDIGRSRAPVMRRVAQGFRELAAAL